MAAATWNTKRQKSRIDVIVDPFETLADDVIDRLIDEVQRLGRFLEVSTHLTVLSRRSSCRASPSYRRRYALHTHSPEPKRLRSLR